jgi:hypothetical protein
VAIIAGVVISGFQPAGVAVIVGGVGWIAVPWILWGGWAFGRSLGREVRVAAQPLPSPAQISAQLEAEWGRPATVEEVAAVHQMLASRRNEALINSGVGVGALYLMNKNLHRR